MMRSQRYNGHQCVNAGSHTTCMPAAPTACSPAPLPSPQPPLPPADARSMKIPTQKHTPLNPSDPSSVECMHRLTHGWRSACCRVAASSVYIRLCMLALRSSARRMRLPDTSRPADPRPGSPNILPDTALLSISSGSLLAPTSPLPDVSGCAPLPPPPVRLSLPRAEPTASPLAG
eukprot:244132-Chlamydomonas_euryale.AAC.11